MELADSQRQDNFLYLEREKDQDKRREGSVYTSHRVEAVQRGEFMHPKSGMITEFYSRKLIT